MRLPPRALASSLCAALLVASCLDPTLSPPATDASRADDLADAPPDASVSREAGAGIDATGPAGDAPAASDDRAPATECARDGDCDDRIACTVDRCTAGRCIHSPDDIACDDRVACTQDRCGATGCEHTAVPARCATGQTCDPMRGCTGGRVCATNGDCADTDPCTTNERCDSASRVCQYGVLDGDGDGFPPRVCAGTDCDDGDPSTNPMETERCNGRDDDCDGEVDEQATCYDGTGACRAGRCECPAGREPCFGAGVTRCVDVTTDRSHCGACGRACDALATGCRGGLCQCPAGTTRCDLACVDLQTSPYACGACGNACPRGEVCAAGACTCAPGETRCNGYCVDTRTSVYSCGACGNACPWSAPYCVAGACAACPAGQTDCNGQCLDTQTDRWNCGACGQACAGECVAGRCTCPAPRVWCGSACVDLRSDANHCGVCNNRCEVFGEFDGGVGVYTGSTCVNGRCPCDGPGYQLCPVGGGTDGGIPIDASWRADGGTAYVCTETLSNRESCGACGRRCAPGRERCAGGACECNRCDGVCTDLSTSQNCGRCGAACPSGLTCQRYSLSGFTDGYYCARPSRTDAGG